MSGAGIGGLCHSVTWFTAGVRCPFLSFVHCVCIPLRFTGSTLGDGGELYIVLTFKNLQSLRQIFKNLFAFHSNFMDILDYIIHSCWESDCPRHWVFSSIPGLCPITPPFQAWLSKRPQINTKSSFLCVGGGMCSWLGDTAFRGDG